MATGKKGGYKKKAGTKSGSKTGGAKEEMSARATVFGLSDGQRLTRGTVIQCDPNRIDERRFGRA